MRLTDSQLENVITMLGWSPHGNVISRMIEGMVLPEEYGLIASRCRGYWKQHNQPPALHLPDLFDDILTRSDDPRAVSLRSILSQMQVLKDGINAGYVISKMSKFRRVIAMRQAVLDVAARLSREDETTVEDAEEMLSTLLRSREVEFDQGLSLESLDTFMRYLQVERGFPIGIGPLDKIGITPTRKTLMCKLGVAGRGKTWFLVHCGKQALRQGLRVVHFSLEIDAPSVLSRYYQSLFGASEHQVRHIITELQTDHTGRVTATKQTETDPAFAFRHDDQINPELQTELTVRLTQMGTVAENLRIRSWPPRIASIDSIEAYLDTLADMHHFQPDLILVDYPQLLKASVNHYRLELGQNVEHLRRVAIERNAAMVIVHQSSRAGAQSKRVSMTHIAEDWSVVQTADFLLSYSATESEQAFGLARLHIDKARVPGAKGKTLILSQNYDLGQYCLTSELMPPNYLDYMEAKRAQPAGSATDAASDDDAPDDEDDD